MSASHNLALVTIGIDQALEKINKIHQKTEGNYPLLGVYEINTHTVYLMPCIRERVNVEMDSNKQIICGKLVDQSGEPIRELNSQEIKEYNTSQFAPRFYTESSDPFEEKSAHQYFLNLMGQTNKSKAFRGFCVEVKGNTLNFEWVSGALNSPKGQRVRGAIMEEIYQQQIYQQFSKGLNALHSDLNLQPLAGQHTASPSLANTDQNDTPPTTPRKNPGISYLDSNASSSSEVDEEAPNYLLQTPPRKK